MTMIICLAITCGLIGLLFLYIRQKMAMYDVRLNTLTDVIQTLAHELSPGMKPINLEPDPESDSDSNSDSNSDTESDSDCEGDLKPIEIVINSEIKPEIKHIDLNELDKIEVSDDEVKTIDLSTNVNNLTVKELKEKVAAMGGPALKTRKALLEFLENKM